MAQGVVTQISENDIVDNTLRKNLNINMSNSMEDINIKIEQLRIAIMAIGQMITSICNAIENSSNNPIKTEYNSITSGTADYSGTKDNFYSIILQLSRGNLPQWYREGRSTENGNPSATNRHDYANTICKTTNAANYYYGNDLDNHIFDAIKKMNEKIKQSKGSYININTYTKDSNIF